ncbi:ABC transporter permease [Rhizobium sp. Root1204]|uniref:ABC transporter permease n=1 Tax=Rhizobium sp. Root1204 TaxID=1736428 RepID=UPI000AC9EADD|nr:ABC transporter permease [Rhizobium sp. Root1204]
MAGLMRHNGARAFLAVLFLVILGAITAPTTVQSASIVGMLPFAAILALAAIGQHLVIQQRGLDISVAAIFSFGAMVVTAMQFSDGGVGSTFALICIALLAGGVFGLVNGLVVTVLLVPPLIVTIAMNSIVFGLVLFISGGVSSAVSPAISAFSLGRTVGIPNPVIAAFILICVVAFVLSKTTLGRRFQVAGLSGAMGLALGFRVQALKIGAYVAAGILFSAAGVLFAGLSDVPSLFAGNDYMLATFAAYIVGGNSIAGDRGSILATAIGAFFLTFLGQLVVSLGFDTSAQYIIQAIIVLIGVGLPSVAQRLKFA